MVRGLVECAVVGPAAPTQGGRTYWPMHLLDLELFTAYVAYSSFRFIVRCNETLSDIPSVGIVRNKFTRFCRCVRISYLRYSNIHQKHIEIYYRLQSPTQILRNRHLISQKTSNVDRSSTRIAIMFG